VDCVTFSRILLVEGVLITRANQKVLSEVFILHECCLLRAQIDLQKCSNIAFHRLLFGLLPENLAGDFVLYFILKWRH
jgi:hypothetical protein